MGFFKFGDPAILLRSLDLVKCVLLDNFKSFQANDVHLEKDLDPLLSMNPFFVTGDEWKYKRSQVTPIMTASKIKSAFPLVYEICKRFAGYIEQRSLAGEDFEARTVRDGFTATPRLIDLIDFLQYTLLSSTSSTAIVPVHHRIGGFVCVRCGSGGVHQLSVVVRRENQEDVRDLDASIDSLDGHILPANYQSHGEFVVSEFTDGHIIILLCVTVCEIPFGVITIVYDLNTCGINQCQGFRFAFSVTICLLLIL